jgi:predicted metalloendopeptidase
MTELKVLHIKFIETFTKGEDHNYNKEKINDFYNTIDIKFREALEYEKQVTNDRTRLTAFEILYEEINANYKTLIDNGDLFSKPFSEELIGEVEKNYDLAIKGELSRRNAPTN